MNHLFDANPFHYALASRQIKFLTNFQLPHRHRKHLPADEIQHPRHGAEYRLQLVAD